MKLCGKLTNHYCNHLRIKHNFSSYSLTLISCLDWFLSWAFIVFSSFFVVVYITILFLIHCRHSSTFGNRHCFDQDRLHENDHINLSFLLTLLLLSFEKLKLMLVFIHIKVMFNKILFTHFCSRCFVRWNLICKCYMSARNIRILFESFLHICWSVSCQLYFLVRYEKFDNPKWQNIIKFADCFKLTLLVLLLSSKIKY